MYTYITIVISSLCIIAGAIVKLYHANNIYARVLFIIGLIGFVFLLIRFIINKLHKQK
jgi:O-antigen ligase